MTLLTLGHAFAYEMECVLRLFFPGEHIVICNAGVPDAPDTVVTRRDRDAGGAPRLTVWIRLSDAIDEAALALDADASDAQTERALARLLYGLLKKHTGICPPWGILTGVRPVRLYRTIAQGGADPQEAMREQYLVSDKKIALLKEVDQVQRALLKQAQPDGFSLYVSIPFCPSRCLYCSFVSHDIAGVAKLVGEYVGLLCEEIRLTGEIARRLGLCLQTVYIGGGTPTTLSPEELARIMAAISESFDCSRLLEYTVEAGRPDTVTPEKLAVIKRMGADRISINPQTMDDALLREIGRGHTAAQVKEAFALAREAGFDAINMDLIAGLPGDAGEGLAYTLERVLLLEPENVTVHALTVKRSSRLRESGEAYADPRADLSAQLDGTGIRLTQAGFCPYYLYRQKGTVQNLENTGWAMPGKEGLYNVLMMEEVQTIFAVGAGASTKLLRADGALERIYNYKFPYEYIARFDEVRRRKLKAESLLKIRRGAGAR